jgi:hypothetical protein
MPTRDAKAKIVIKRWLSPISFFAIPTAKKAPAV